MAAVAAMTALLLAFGGLVELGIFPVRTDFPGNPLRRAFIEFWAELAVWLGLVVPTLALLLGWRRPVWRRAVGYYLLVLFAQLYQFEKWMHARQRT